MFQIANVQVPLNPDLMSPVIIEALQSGRYEKAKARLLPAMIETGDRVVDLGGGIGVVSTLVALQGKAELVVCVEGNPDMLPMIDAVAQLNGVNVVARNALISPEARRGKSTFYVHRDLWASSPTRPPSERVLRVLEIETATPASWPRSMRPTC